MTEKLIEGVEQSARQGVLAATWPCYREYRVERYADGEVWATAEFPAPLREGRWADLSEEQRKRALPPSDLTASGRARLYSPLTDAPDLFIRFARWETTEEAWLSFLRCYGALGPDPRRDRYSRFCQEVRRAKRVLEFYEAATTKPVPDVKAIAGIFGEDGVLQDPDLWAMRTAPQRASGDALKEVDAVIREMLRAETFGDLYSGSYEEQPLPSWGAHSLLGNVWLEFFFARTSIREPRRCKAEDCPNFLPASSGGKKATYKNKKYCSKACAERQRYRDRRWSRTLSRGDGTI
jgi:hypothetical protein